MQAIEPPPRDPIIDDRGLLSNVWDKWFRIVSNVVLPAQRFEVALTPASVGANTTSEQAFTVERLTTRDMVIVNKPTHQTGLGIVNARVSAANTLRITFMNVSGGAIVPTAETYFILAVRI